jgi:hypothetical protein
VSHPPQPACKPPLPKGQLKRFCLTFDCGEDPQLPKDHDTLFLHEIVFALSDDEHRTRGVSYDPFGGTAQKHMFQAGMAVSRDDDQVGFAIAGEVRDYFKGGAHSNDHFFQELRLDRLFRQCIQFFLEGLDRELFAHGEYHWIRRRLESMKQRDLCFKVLREWRRVFECLLRDFREINWHEDTLEFEDYRDEFRSIVELVLSVYSWYSLIGFCAEKCKRIAVVACFSRRMPVPIIIFHFPRIDNCPGS